MSWAHTEQILVVAVKVPLSAPLRSWSLNGDMDQALVAAGVVCLLLAPSDLKACQSMVHNDQLPTSSLVWFTRPAQNV